MTSQDTALTVTTGTTQSGVGFSSYLFKNAARLRLTGENSDQNVDNTANVHRFWLSILDNDVMRAKVVSEFAAAFVIENVERLFGSLFPVEITLQTTFEMNELIFNTHPTPLGVRKVPGRTIHYKKTNRKASSVYTGEGFEVDYQFIKTPDGMRYFDMMLNATITDIWATIVHATLYEIQNTVPRCILPEQKHPYGTVPTTITALMNSERIMFGAINKDPQAINLIKAEISRMLENNGGGPAEIMIVSKDMENFIRCKDQTNVFYDGSGRAAIDNRNGAKERKTVAGMDAIVVPLLTPSLHGPHDFVLRHVIQTGDFFVFSGNSSRADSSKFKSYHRDIKFASWQGPPEKHSFKKFLHHCPEFYPLNHTDTDKAGKINSELLLDAFKHAGELCKSTHLMSNGSVSPETVHMFLTSDAEGDPVVIERFIQIVIVKHHSKTLEHAILKIMSEDQKKKLFDNLASSSDTPPQTVEIELFLRRVKEVCRLDQVIGFSNQMVEALKINGILLSSSSSSPSSSPSSSSSSSSSYSTIDVNILNILRLVYKKGSTNSLFTMLYGLCEVNLQTIDSFIEHDVDVALGGFIARPFCEQWMESIPISSGGPIGKLLLSGLDDTVSFDDKTQHISVQTFGHFRPIVTRRERVMVAPFVRGMTILGGKGDHYINENADGAIEYNSDEWKQLVYENFGSGERLGKYSMIPVLQPYTSDFEGDFRKRHMDMRGFFDRNDYIGRMHVSDDFPTERHNQMYPNQLFINHVFPFTSRSVEPIDPENLTFDQYATRRRVNNLVSQGSQYVWDALKDDWSLVTSSTLWGEEIDDIRYKQNSTDPVRRTK